MSLTIGASLSMQNIGRSGTQLLNIQQYDRMSMQKSKIMSNQDMSQKQKDSLLDKLEDQQNDLLKDVEEIQKKQDAKKKAMDLKQKAKDLANIYDSETAKSIMKMDQLVQMTAKADTADQQSVDELQDVMDDIDTTEIGKEESKSVNQMIDEAVDQAEDHAVNQAMDHTTNQKEYIKANQKTRDSEI